MGIGSPLGKFDKSRRIWFNSVLQTATWILFSLVWFHRSDTLHFSLSLGNWRSPQRRTTPIRWMTTTVVRWVTKNWSNLRRKPQPTRQGRQPRLWWALWRLTPKLLLTRWGSPVSAVSLWQYMQFAIELRIYTSHGLGCRIWNLDQLYLRLQNFDLW